MSAAPRGTSICGSVPSRLLVVLSVTIAMLTTTNSAPAATGTRSLGLVHVSYGPSTAKTLARHTAAPNSNSTSYSDPAGDNEVFAPDITNVTFANDDAGMIGMRADTPTDPFLLSGTFFAVFLDTDQNPSTGNCGFRLHDCH